MMRTLAVAAYVILSGCAGVRPPDRYPEIIPETSHDAIVVAKTTPGGYLPQFARCEEPDVICMDPPPFWFRTKVLDVLFGPINQSSIAAATTSHYGMETLGTAQGPLLLRLMVNGGAIVMVRYAQTGLDVSIRGDLFLILGGPEPIWWLPCSAMEVAVDIDPAEFAEELLIPEDYVSDEEISGLDDYLIPTEGGYLPRKALAVADLKQHLRERYAGQRLPECHPE